MEEIHGQVGIEVPQDENQERQYHCYLESRLREDTPDTIQYWRLHVTGRRGRVSTGFLSNDYTNFHLISKQTHNEVIENYHKIYK